MKPVHRSILSMLDAAVRWTGIPARVEERVSDSRSIEHTHRSLRWSPMGPIAFSCALFIFALMWPSALDRVPPGAAVAFMGALMAGIMSTAGIIYRSGPLGKPFHENDEREMALRKDALLFCFGFLAVVNCLGQPILLMLSHLQHWRTVHGASVVVTALTLNVALLGSLPTLYASWHSPQLPKE